MRVETMNTDRKIFQRLGVLANVILVLWALLFLLAGIAADYTPIQLYVFVVLYAMIGMLGIAAFFISGNGKLSIILKVVVIGSQAFVFARGVSNYYMGPGMIEWSRNAIYYSPLLFVPPMTWLAILFFRPMPRKDKGTER